MKIVIIEDKDSKMIPFLEGWQEMFRSRNNIMPYSAFCDYNEGDRCFFLNSRVLVAKKQNGPSTEIHTPIIVFDSSHGRYWRDETEEERKEREG